ncbi:MAG: thiamine pyrophosphate-binding protein [Candidatus Omnitrophota bacterium]
MIASDYLARFFSRNNTRVIFGMTGGMIAFLVDSIYRHGKINFISMHHEQAAAFAAEAYARLTGRPGVAMATSGPGATNLITGIGSCYFDSSPVVFITGQVSTKDFKGSSGVRQQGFQEADIISIVKPIVKGAWMVDKTSKISWVLEKAFWLAKEGRPGPVLIDIPIDVQQKETGKSYVQLPESKNNFSEALEKFTHKMYRKLSKSKKPLVLVGGGIQASRSRNLFLKWIEKVDIPVVNSLMGADVLPYGHPNRVGMIGSYGNRYANLAVKETDCLLVLGSRLDSRQTGSDANAFRENKDIFQIDCDKNQLNNRVKRCEIFCCDLKIFFNSATRNINGTRKSGIDEWRLKIKEWRKKYPDTKELSCGGGEINPNQLMHIISRFSGSCVGYAVDVGQHQMWAAQSIELKEKQRFLTSGGMGSTGFGLPAAIGMAFAMPKKPVVLIAGDGGFQLNIQELETVRRNNLPLKMIIINNHCLGMVRQFQDEYFAKRYSATHVGYTSPDFVKISAAYNIAAKTIQKRAEIENALAWLWRDPLSPTLLNVEIPIFLNVYPKIKFKSSIADMEPIK